MATLVQVSVGGAGVVTGVVTPTLGQTAQLSLISTVGVTQVRFELYAYPPDMTVPAGWSTDSDGSVTGRPGTYYYLGTGPGTLTPPIFTMALWGKYIWQAKINGNVASGADPLLTDDTGGARINSTLGLIDLAAWEDQRFGGIPSNRFAYEYALAKNLRILDGSAGWSTVLDFDFSTVTPVTIGSDTTTAVGGKTFTSHNAANTSGGFVINGSGLIITPLAAPNWAAGFISAPRLFLPFSQMGIANLDWTTSIRAFARVTASNDAADFDNAFMDVGTDVGSHAWSWTLFRGRNGGQGAWVRRFRNNGAYTSSNRAFALGASNDAMRMDIDCLNGVSARCALGTFAASFGATPWNWTYGMWDADTSVPDTNLVGTDPSILGVSLGGVRAGSGTAFAVTMTKLRVDVHY